jgi:hypothetical protein
VAGSATSTSTPIRSRSAAVRLAADHDGLRQPLARDAGDRLQRARVCAFGKDEAARVGTGALANPFQEAH